MEEIINQSKEDLTKKEEQPIALEHLMLIRRKKGYSFFKRIFDFVVSTAGLVVGAIPMIVFAVLLTIESKGGAFYKEQRLGRYGAPFKYVKFKTSATEDGEPFGKISAFLNRTKLENLPQLWSIFKGKMSFVGPKAESSAAYENNDRLMPGFSQRLKAKPGITGLSQVNAKQATNYEKATLDIEYLKKRNVFLDAKILFKAIVALFSKK